MVSTFHRGEYERISMPDPNEGSAGADDSKGTESEKTDQPGDDSDKSSADDSGTDDGAQDDKSGADNSGGEDKSKVDNKSQQDDDEEPPRRKSTRDYILERKGRKLEKQEKSKAPEADDDEDDDSGSDETVTKAGQRAINKAVEPILSIVKRQADDAELNEVYMSHPEARKYDREIRKHMEVYKDTPAEFIWMGLAAKKGLLNQKAKDEADAEANANKSGGHTKRPKEEKEKDAWDLTDEEFEKKVGAVQGNR